MSENANRRILLVDDTDSIHLDFRKILTAQPPTSSSANSARVAFFGAPSTAVQPKPETYEVESARQGQEALVMVQRAVAEQKPFALAFVDVRMPPGWDGVETIERLWQVDRELQVVICSAYTDYSWADMLARLGRTDRLLFLKKPFDPIEVCQLASALTQKWNATRREHLRMEEALTAEKEARAYAASLTTVNRALETARARAEAATRAKSEFLANMSHEIRTPMIAILGYADLLRDLELPANERSEHLETIHVNGRRLLSTLDGILDMARIETGRLEIEQRACSPASIVDEVVACRRDSAIVKGLQLSVQRAGAIPESIRSDPSRLRQILTALVDNAIKFTSSGSVRIELGMHPTEPWEDPRLSISITDTGIGITPEVRARLFEAFSQGDNSLTREHGGAGLGLALARRLAQVLGGDVTVESTPGAGSCFTLTIAAVASAGPAPERARAHPDTTSALTGRVLLVEDSPVTLRLHEQFLRIAGAQVGLAENGRLACDLALEAQREGRPFDLILMDMQMPVMDGYDATRELRARDYRHPIVALTAHANAGDRQRCLDAGCDDYVPKPVDRAAFLEICRQWMDPAAVPAPLPASSPLGAPSSAPASALLTDRPANRQEAQGPSRGGEMRR